MATTPPQHPHLLHFLRSHPLPELYSNSLSPQTLNDQFQPPFHFHLQASYLNPLIQCATQLKTLRLSALVVSLNVWVLQGR